MRNLTVVVTIWSICMIGVYLDEEVEPVGDDNEEGEAVGKAAVGNNDEVDAAVGYNYKGKEAVDNSDKADVADAVENSDKADAEDEGKEAVGKSDEVDAAVGYNDEGKEAVDSSDKADAAVGNNDEEEVVAIGNNDEEYQKVGNNDEEDGAVGNKEAKDELRELFIRLRILRFESIGRLHLLYHFEGANAMTTTMTPSDYDTKVPTQLQQYAMTTETAGKVLTRLQKHIITAVLDYQRRNDVDVMETFVSRTLFEIIRPTFVVRICQRAGQLDFDHNQFMGVGPKQGDNNGVVYKFKCDISALADGYLQPTLNGDIWLTEGFYEPRVRLLLPELIEEDASINLVISRLTRHLGGDIIAEADGQVLFHKISYMTEPALTELSELLKARRHEGEDHLWVTVRFDGFYIGNTNWPFGWQLSRKSLDGLLVDYIEMRMTREDLEIKTDSLLINNDGDWMVSNAFGSVVTPEPSPQIHITTGGFS